MKELFDCFERIGFEKKGLVLLDTCFLFYMLEHHQRLADNYNFALSSFTVEEILHVAHKVKKYKTNLRKFLKSNPKLVIVETPVHPGEWEKEREFVNSVDPQLLKHLPDASDAVLVAVALKTNSLVLTKDKHDIFQIDLLNYLKDSKVSILKELKDLP